MHSSRSPRQSLHLRPQHGSTLVLGCSLNETCPPPQSTLESASPRPRSSSCASIACNPTVFLPRGLLSCQPQALPDSMVPLKSVTHDTDGAKERSHCHTKGANQHRGVFLKSKTGWSAPLAESSDARAGPPSTKYKAPSRNPASSPCQGSQLPGVSQLLLQ